MKKLALQTRNLMCGAFDAVLHQLNLVPHTRQPFRRFAVRYEGISVATELRLR
jgi:hypothetical protein